jgi:hypothetical protein
MGGLFFSRWSKLRKWLIGSGLARVNIVQRLFRGRWEGEGRRELGAGSGADGRGDRGEGWPRVDGGGGECRKVERELRECGDRRKTGGGGGDLLGRMAATRNPKADLKMRICYGGGVSLE